MTVVAAFKLDDFVASGEGPHQAQNRHASFSTGVNESDHFMLGTASITISASTFSNTEGAPKLVPFPGLRGVHR